MRFKTLAVIVAALLIGFLGGITVSQVGAASGINAGLVVALNSVGQNLLGADSFAARATTLPNGRSALVLDMATTTGIPILVNVFVPPNPCLTEYRVSLNEDGAGTVKFYTEQTLDVVQVGEVADLTDLPPSPCMSVGIAPGGG